MKFSLVTTTIGRGDVIRSLLASLAAQQCQDFELIVVDQNDDDRVTRVLASCPQQFEVIRIQSGRGASRGRNAGMAQARGQIVAFPDDDCVYPPELLANVARWMDEKPDYDGLTGCNAADPYWAKRPVPLTRYNVWKRGIEYAMFLRRPLFEKVGQFDETIGPGANSPWGAGEGTEYLLRALAGGFKIYFDPAIRAFHPMPSQTFEVHREKTYKYAMGKGRVLHLAKCPGWFNAINVVRPLVGSALSLARGSIGDARIGWAAACGIRRGLIDSARERKNGQGPKK